MAKPTPETARPSFRRATPLAPLLLLAFALLWLPPVPARGSEAETPAPSEAGEEPPADAAPVVDGIYLRPNVELPDGSWAYVHVTPDDMPWRVAIGRPPRPPKYGSSTQAREVAIEAMREWEKAVQPELPWFRLEFVEKDRKAPVQVQWKRRITGPYSGFGRMTWRLTDEGVRVGGHMEISTTPSRYVTLELDEVRLLVAHEFGHVLGLGHCLDCSSAMSYSWHAQDTINVTDVDVRTFLALVEQPNGDVVARTAEPAGPE